jgi:N-methylhydantoinase A
VERGRDPRESALLAFGGAGPLFGPMCGHEMDLKEVIIPNAPSGFSAWGMLSADVVDDFSRTHIALIAEVTPESLGVTFAEIEKEAAESLRLQDVKDGQAMLLRQLELRYLGQEHALPIDVGATIDTDAIMKSFGDQHEARYGHQMVAPVQILTIRIRAVGNTSKPTLRELPARGVGKSAPRPGTRRAYCFTTREMTEFATYKRADLAPGDSVTGPALVDEGTSVTVMHTGQTLSVDRYGHLIIAMAG